MTLQSSALARDFAISHRHYGWSPGRYLDVVEAPMTFLAADSEQPKVYMPPAEGGEVVRTGQYDTRPVTIHNGRSSDERYDLERHGFTLIKQASRVRHFDDSELVEALYYPEIEKLVKAQTGASRVVIFDHTVRSGDNSGRDASGVREPVRMVHNDYTEKSGPQRVRDLMGDDAELLLPHRFAQVNVWRPIVGPVESTPLALVEAQSIAPGDLVPMDLIYPDRTGEIYYAKHNPDHRWVYFPDMQTDEAILIKGYDSEIDGRARFTLHSAFDDPNTPAGAALRQSIEVRTLAFFEPDPFAHW